MSSPLSCTPPQHVFSWNLSSVGIGPPDDCLVCVCGDYAVGIYGRNDCRMEIHPVYKASAA